MTASVNQASSGIRGAGSSVATIVRGRRTPARLRMGG
jgi:hypothetical protein